MNMLVYVTAPEENIANAIASELLANRLAAGVNISSPCHSVYRWRGEVKSKLELQLFIQINALDYENVEKLIRQLHPYDTPCIVGLPIETGFDKFMSWIENRGHESENSPDCAG